MNHAERLKQFQSNFDTLAVSWQMFFGEKYPLPAGSFFEYWIRNYPMDTIIAAFEFVSADLYHKDSNHLARVIALALRDVQYEPAE